MSTGAVPSPVRPAQRVPPDRFQLPIDRMRAGYYSDKDSVRARDVLAGTGRNPRVTMQVFQKQAAWLGGVDEAIAILKLCLTSGYQWTDLEVHALRDGDRVAPRETAMLIEGPYVAFAHLETLYLGVMARRTRVATNTRLVVEAAWPKPVLFFPPASTIGRCRPATAMRRTLPEQSVCRPTPRPRGGGRKGSGWCRTR